MSLHFALKYTTRPIRSQLRRLCLLLCSVVFAPLCLAKPLVVGTYAYPDIDRQAAVTPLANWLAGEQKQAVTIIVAKSPNDLVAMARTGSVDLVMPNLVAYLQIQQHNKMMHNFLLPAGQQALQQPVYTSSLLGHEIADLDQLYLLLQQGQPLRIVAVWPDSASGGLIAIAWLKQQFASHFSQLKFDYVGSHQAVLPALSSSQPSLGIMATAALPTQQTAGISEIWRSAELPFGALLCNSQTLPCAELSRRLLKSPLAAAVLQGLQQGWSEFRHSTQLAPVDETSYQQLRSLLSTTSQP